MTAHRVEVLTFDGCPHVSGALRVTREIAARLVPGSEVEDIRVENDEHARRLGFLGSPSIRVDGEDIEGRTSGPCGLSCRVYRSPGGSPPAWMIEAALLRAIRPGHFLFLCVANSARSQMAEGIARSLAPSDVRVSSSGSSATRVREEAVKVLREIGIDISSQSSKGLGDIDADSVDAVVTLCAEEVCPAFLGPATRVHWGLPDPAAVQSGEQDRLTAFRSVRDELRLRLGLLFR
ncbi:MAG: arsenate reductase ArsC [Acidobacteriota bacterium]